MPIQHKGGELPEPWGRTNLLLALPHGQELDPVPSEARPLGQLHEVGGRVRAGAEDEDDGRVGGALLKDGLEADHRRLDVPGEKRRGEREHTVPTASGAQEDSLKRKQELPPTSRPW